MTLTHVEMQERAISLQGNCLFAGLYLNELLSRLLQKGDAHATLYTQYAETLSVLRTPPLAEKTLRSFEKRLLEALGYGLLFKQAEEGSQHFLPDQYYCFIPDQGFVQQSAAHAQQVNSSVFLGETLLSIANEAWENEVCLAAAKRLTRCVLMPLLGTRPLYSRQLFMIAEE
jgi:DNA repair protein RecO (recombination protein O)